MLYNPVEVTVAENQKENLRKLIDKKYLPVKIVVKGVTTPTHTLYLTRGQTAKIEKAKEIGRRKYKTIQMSRKQIDKNRKFQGHGVASSCKLFEDELAEDTTKEPMQTTENVKTDDGVYFIKHGHTMKVLPVKENGLYLQEHPSMLTKETVADGLYVKHGNMIENAERIILDKSSPFHNVSILQWLL